MELHLAEEFTFVDQSPMGTNLVRGPRPYSLGTIMQFQTVINLEEGWFEFFHRAEATEKEWCKAAKASYLHRPMSDFLPPTRGQLVKAVNEIQSGLCNGNVLVHCLHGKDRTGMVIAAHRILVNRWPVTVAINEMQHFGFHNLPYFFWKESLRDLNRPW